MSMIPFPPSELVPVRRQKNEPTSGISNTRFSVAHTDRIIALARAGRTCSEIVDIMYAPSKAFNPYGTHGGRILCSAAEVTRICLSAGVLLRRFA